MVRDALKMAVIRRRLGSELTCHSDQGSQYVSNLFRDFLAYCGITKSMSRRGDCWDNAVAESFFAAFKSDLIDRKSWPTRQMLELPVNNISKSSTIGRDYILLLYTSVLSSLRT